MSRHVGEAPGRVRLLDIAAQAGVSEATVSRVLNGRPGVRASTRQAVLTALDVLGYERPSRLRPTQAGLVGLIVPELSNPVFPAFAQHIEMRLAPAGYTAVLCTQSPGGVHEDDYIDMLSERGVAGMIFVSGLHADTAAPTDRYTRLADRGLPMVFVNGHRREIDAPSMSTDDARAVALAVDHLRTLGHQRIGLIVGPERYLPAQRKIEAFLAQAGPAAQSLVARSFYGVEGGAQAGSELLDKGATGIVCASDIMALGAISTAHARGLAVPEHVSVVGFDDSPLMAFTGPPLTTVRQNVQALSSAAVEAFLTEVSGQRAPRGEVLFRPELIVRGSTAPAPAY